MNTICLTMDDVKAVPGLPSPGLPNKENSAKEYFLNFAFPGTTWTPGSVNGRQYAQPTVSALTQLNELNDECRPENCGEQKICTCNYNITTGQVFFGNMDLLKQGDNALGSIVCSLVCLSFGAIVLSPYVHLWEPYEGQP